MKCIKIGKYDRVNSITRVTIYTRKGHSGLKKVHLRCIIAYQSIDIL